MRTPAPPPTPPNPDTLSVQVGGWFKASATGRGVFVIGVTLVVLVGGLMALVFRFLKPAGLVR